VAEKMKFYRYEDVEYEYGPRIYERIFYLVRETPCGYWISSNLHYNEKDENEWFFHISERKKWVSKTARKRFAYPDRESAMDNFRARKRRQIDILEYRLNRAKMALDAATDGQNEVDKQWTVGMRMENLRISRGME
jgi:hypothetical protein